MNEFKDTLVECLQADDTTTRRIISSLINSLNIEVDIIARGLPKAESPEKLQQGLGVIDFCDNLSYNLKKLIGVK